MNLKQKISLTGYRLLFILQILMQGPKTKDELLGYIAAQEGIQPIGHDTLRLDLNTLCATGFEIETKYLQGEYRYALNWSPISISLTKGEIKELNALKRALLDISDHGYIVKLYRLFGKIAKYFKDPESAEELLNFGCFLSIDLEMLEKLTEYCDKKEEIEFVYDSPKSGERVRRACCLGIEYNQESKKLYLCSKTNEHSEESYFRVERVKRLLGVCKDREIEAPKTKTYTFCVKQNEGFQTKGAESVERIGGDIIEVKTTTSNKFFLKQRLLSLGTSCTTVEDGDLRQEILKELLSTRSLYK